jgi:predicted nucleotidyltransferase
MHELVENNREAIAKLCRRHGARKLEVFGSILRDDFDTERSNVDVLVEFEADMGIRNSITTKFMTSR